MGKRGRQGKGERKGCMGRQKKGRETKMSGFYREEPLEEWQPSSWKAQGWGKDMPGRAKGCWENLEARSALECKTCTSPICPGSQSQPRAVEGHLESILHMLHLRHQEKAGLLKAWLCLGIHFAHRAGIGGWLTAGSQ